VVNFVHQASPVEIKIQPSALTRRAGSIVDSVVLYL
jgi:hypothetical protein